MGQLKLFLFGPPRLEREGQTIQISQRKDIGLLVYLAVTRQTHSRDGLATLFWPQKDQRSARANLRRVLHQLNHSLGDDVLLPAPEMVSINPQADLWLDIEAYRQRVVACLPLPDPFQELGSDCLHILAEAAAFYTADFLAGFTLPDCPDFDEWQFFQAESLRQSLAQVLAQLASAYQHRGQFEPAITCARRWLALDPLHEPAQRQLMQLYDRSGQPAAALRQYQECARLLEEELGLPPSEETTTLYEAIKARQLLAPFIREAAETSRETGPVQKSQNKERDHFAAAHRSTEFRPETRYARSGEVYIAYQVLGEGPVDVVFVGGFVSHLEHLWEEPDLGRFFRRLAEVSRLILFDKRGIGLSDRVGYVPSLEHTMDDVLAVMNAVGSKRAVLFGVSQGGPNSVLLAATYPERVSALIIYGSLAKWLRSPDYPWGITAEQFEERLARYASEWGGPVRLEYMTPGRARDPYLQQWWAKLLRLASSPGAIKAVLGVTRDIDVRHILPTVHVPTLVLHRTGDRITPLEAGRHMAQLIPGAKFVELAGSDHLWWVGDVDTLLAEIEMFLKQLIEAPPTAQMLATILLVEACPKNAAEQGDSQDQTVLAAFKPLIRQEISRFRGLEIKSGGNRFLAAFDGPSRAIRCALAIRALARAHEFVVRVGLHSGEYTVIQGELGGEAARIVAGVMDKAAPGEVLVSATVKGLVAGAGFDFRGRGSFILSDVSGEWQLYGLE